MEGWSLEEGRRKECYKKAGDGGSDQFLISTLKIFDTLYGSWSLEGGAALMGELEWAGRGRHDLILAAIDNFWHLGPNVRFFLGFMVYKSAEGVVA